MSFSGSVRTGLRVTGLNEAINALNNINRNLPVTKSQILREAATTFVLHAQANVHVVSGKLQRSIRVDSVTDKQAIVSANTPYARIEDSREGNKAATGTPHSFMAPSADATAQRFPGIITKRVNDLFGKNKTNTGFGF